MLTAILNFAGDDETRRQRLYDGAILFSSATPESLALVQHAQDLARETFGDLDPQHAQEHMSVEEFIARVAPLKSAFPNGSETKELVRAYTNAMGMDPERTYFDVPRLRVVPHSDYLTAGVSYAYKAHRDQWYGGASSQLNYWMPVFPVTPDSAMVFYPGRWDRPCLNSSADFDYREWVEVGRPAALKQVKQDTRKHPLPLEPLLESEELRYGAQSGDAIIFAAAHLHATAPNTSARTRFSIDFRTVNLDDLQQGRGAPNIDSEAKGTTLALSDFLRVSDFVPLDAERLVVS